MTADPSFEMRRVTPLRKSRFSPGWAPESSRRAACSEAHPPEFEPAPDLRPDGRWNKSSKDSKNSRILTNEIFHRSLMRDGLANQPSHNRAPNPSKRRSV